MRLQEWSVPITYHSHLLGQVAEEAALISQAPAFFLFGLKSMFLECCPTVLSAQPSSASPPSWPSKPSMSLKSCNLEVLMLHWGALAWQGRILCVGTKLSAGESSLATTVRSFGDRLRGFPGEELHCHTLL